jgi:methyl-accepting chemotaxis protein
MIDAIKSGTTTVVEAMQKGKASTAECNTQVTEAKEILSSLDSAIGNISDAVALISTAARDQANNFEQVSLDFMSLDEQFNQSKKAGTITVQVGADMSTMSLNLHEMVKHFKLSDQDWCTLRRNTVRLNLDDIRESGK